MTKKVHLLLFITALSVYSVSAQEMPVYKPTEYQIKAAFLYQFAKFVQWPDNVFADSTKQIVIGVFGQDPFGDDLDNTVRGKYIHGRQIEIERYDRLNNINDCQILFISDSETKNLDTIFSKLRHANILTVGDTENFCRKGGIINFIRKENKIHFEINVDAAQTAGLKLSSKLLNLAKIVEGGS